MKAPAARRLPDRVIHADWSCHASKRWTACADLQPDGSYRLNCLKVVTDLAAFSDEIRSAGAARRTLLAGFDFVIGLPASYAGQIGCNHFLEFLTRLARPEWRAFFEPAETPEQISLLRPFYPARPGSAREIHLMQGLGVSDFNALRRRCELARRDRRAASPLFWTMGSQQVGKATLHGWMNILLPALSEKTVRIWPFCGEFTVLLESPGAILCETYPAEYYTGLGIDFRDRSGKRAGKSSSLARADQASVLLAGARNLELLISRDLQSQIETGLGEDGFDALVGLLGMLQVLRGFRPGAAPHLPQIRNLEGWILGQEGPVFNEVDYSSVGIMT